MTADYRKVAVAVDKNDYSEIKEEVKAIVSKTAVDLSRQVETPDNTYVCLYWEWLDWNRPEVWNLVKKIREVKHALISIDEEGNLFRDIAISDKHGCDEEFENILSPEQEICFWNEGEVLEGKRDYLPISRARLKTLLQQYIENDWNENHVETSSMYRSLNNAGFTDHEIEMLGFGFCVPEEGNDLEIFRYSEFCPEEMEV